jgi:radical SAM protein with 4Fe4S-binding SPASM domain
MKKETTVVDNSCRIKEVEVNAGWEKDLLKNSAYREYRRKWKEATEGQTVFGFPLFIEIEASYACNYNCIKCPRAYSVLKPGGELSDELFEKLLKEAQEQNLYSINFSHGGEPLLRKNLSDMVLKSKEAGILDILIHTNASMLTEEMSRRLIENGLTKINFSLDAFSRKTYDKVRPGGDFNKALKNIDNFLKIKKQFGKSYPRVRVSFIVMNENRHEANDFYEFWKDKADLISFQQCMDYSILKDDVKGKIDINKKHICSSLWQMLMISHDGSIMPCLQDYNHELILGNLKTDTIKQCWNSEKLNKMRERHLKNRWHEISMCRRCIGMNSRRLSG